MNLHLSAENDIVDTTQRMNAWMKLAHDAIILTILTLYKCFHVNNIVE